MSMFDNMLAEMGGQIDVDAIADRVGLSPDKVDEAIAALGVAHSQPGDAIETAAASTGFPMSKISAIMAQLGGPDALANLSSRLCRYEVIHSW